MNKTPSWEKLKVHQAENNSLHLRELFAHDTQRTNKFSLSFDEFVIDFSKNRITQEIFTDLVALATDCGVRQKITKLFSGEHINTTEHRPALHMALRAPADSGLFCENQQILSEVQQELARIESFVKRLHRGQITGASGKAIDTIVNIGIGGSDLGPRLCVEALDEYRNTDISIKFVANIDSKDIYAALKEANPETTLFILASKSFTTMETLSNAATAETWLLEHGCQQPKRHFLAITTKVEQAKKYGLHEDNIFRFWDWVGGRYSVWSSVGLSLAIAVGMEHFREFLSGAHMMDQHFVNTETEKNIPIILALLSVWYNNFLEAETHAVVPYDQGLRLLPEYLSQLVMESNGKGVDSRGCTLECSSSPVIWGAIGTNSQHAFFQLLHQSERLIPVDFLAPLSASQSKEHHKKLLANCLAQSKALMLGQNNADEPHRNFPGNRPSNTILYKKLSPKSLGMLLAMYESKTFVEAMIWDINPFDQWGVELGKQLTKDILKDLDGNNTSDSGHDQSTDFLIEQYKREANN